MSERCEQTCKQTSKWPSSYVCILGYSGPLCHNKGQWPRKKKHSERVLTIFRVMARTLRALIVKDPALWSVVLHALLVDSERGIENFWQVDQNWKMPKNHANVMHKCLLGQNMGPVLYMIPPPPLHMLMGGTNAIMNIIIQIKGNTFLIIIYPI